MTMIMTMSTTICHLEKAMVRKTGTRRRSHCATHGLICRDRAGDSTFAGQGHTIKPTRPTLDKTIAQPTQHNQQLSTQNIKLQNGVLRDRARRGPTRHQPRMTEWRGKHKCGQSSPSITCTESPNCVSQLHALGMQEASIDVGREPAQEAQVKPPRKIAYICIVESLLGQHACEAPKKTPNIHAFAKNCPPPPDKAVVLSAVAHKSPPRSTCREPCRHCCPYPRGQTRRRSDRMHRRRMTMAVAMRTVTVMRM